MSVKLDMVISLAANQRFVATSLYSRIANKACDNEKL